MLLLPVRRCWGVGVECLIRGVFLGLLFGQMEDPVPFPTPYLVSF